MTNLVKRFFRKKGADKSIFIATLVLVIFGVIMIGSASIGAVSVDNKTWAIRNMATQAVYVVAGLILMTVLTKIFNTKMIDMGSSLFMFVVGIIAMCVCMIWTTKGSHAWIHIGPFTVQPAEFMKIVMILILSYFLTETDTAFVVKGRFKTEELKSRFYKNKFKMCVVFPILLIGIVCAVGIGIQKDLGTTIILAAICFVCFMATPRTYYKKYKKMALALIAIVAVGLAILTSSVLKTYQVARITSWLHPLDDPYKTSYQLVNSLIAFSDGGLFGLGLGNSVQKYDYIPEAHNDFIGAIIYEELGIVGLAFIIIPTCVIIFKLLKYANEIEDNKSRVILIGISAYFFLHLFVNLGGVSGFIPMTGVPLLLISSGGSSTVSALIAIGIAQAIISKHNKSKLDTKS